MRKKRPTWRVANWQIRAEAALRAVAPDLRGWPVYLVPRSALIGTAVDCLCGEGIGWHHPSYDIVLRPVLSLMGLWLGRGFACIIDDVAIRERAQRVSFAAQRFSDECLGVAAHELAHGLVTSIGVAGLFDSPEADADELAPLGAFLHSATAPLEPDPDEVPWVGHGAPFLRAAAHLRLRLARFDRSWDPSHLGSGGFLYALSEAAAYDAALGPELERTSAPISEILASPPPPAFEALFEEDDARFRRRRPTTAIQER